MRGNLNDFPLTLTLLHFLIAVHQQFHIIGSLSRLPPLPLYAGSQRAGKAACQQHNQESNRIVRIKRRQGKTWNCKEKIKGYHAQQRNQNPVEIPIRPNCRKQNSQQIDNDNVRFAQAEFIK